mgnify:CR=1 FL=1
MTFLLTHNGIKSITIIGLLTLWGQDLVFSNHTQSIINEFSISFKGNIHFGLQVAALPGTTARPTDIVWDQDHKKKIGKGNHDQHFRDTFSKLALTRSFYLDYKDIYVE